MAKITTPVEGFNGKVAGVSFVDGAGETEDATALAYFERQGYTIEAEGEKVVVIPEGEPNDKWKNDELKAYADSKSIDLGDAKKKDEILAVLAAASTPAE